MNHDDHVNLLRAGVTASGGTWADLGSGAGAFTLALADLLGGSGEIYAIDRDASALRELAQAMRTRFPGICLHTITADFTRPLELPSLDGIVMANSLHFVRDKDPVLTRLCTYLKPDGRLLIVEYNTDRGNTWVPYPFSYSTWAALAAKHGFTDTRLLMNRQSRFLDAIYSAVSLNGTTATPQPHQPDA